jgi:DNA-binding NtrC family response regulator
MMKTILVIDDELSVREAFGVVFNGKYETVMCEGGHQALEIVKNALPDLIILDIIMPGMDGIKVLRKLTEMNCPSRVVVITSARTIKLAVEAMKMGACGYITKPLDVEEIRLVVDRTLQLQKPEAILDFYAQFSSEKGLSLQKAVESFEGDLIRTALTVSNGIQTKAAKSLKTSRRILKYKMDKLGIKEVNNEQMVRRSK